MIPLLPYIIGGVAGYLLKASISPKKTTSKDDKSQYYIFLRSPELSKQIYIFDSYKKAKAKYDALVKAKYVTAKYAYENEDTWSDVYEDWKSRGKKMDIPLSHKDPISEIKWGSGSETFESKQF